MSSKLTKYIAQQPQIPKGFRYRTPILISDSKGYTIRNACAQNEFPIESWCKAGARTSELVDVIQERIEKAIKRHNQIVIYLWSGTCDLTIKKGKYIHLRNRDNKTIEQIEKQYIRAIKIVEKYPAAEIKLIDCPILSIVSNNKYKGHNNPETFKTDDFQITRRIKHLNTKIIEINNRLNKNTINISKYFFRGRKSKKGSIRKSVKITINKRDGVHPGQLLSLVIAKQILIDTYSECYHITQESELVTLRVEEEELLTLF
ncbi:unnamed protein product [Mytilus coruscus]|uniref:Uncharacterized protein n=1 Tax=Mytilus coruscus TaxID=42192 RepID=A0A6J8ATV1_MYTCO|nr:unnamed protein product [Mytilus coruscus]